MNKFLKVLSVTALEFAILFWLFGWQNKLYHPTYVSFGVLLFVFWLGLNGTLYEWYLNRKKSYRIDLREEEKLIYQEGKNKLELMFLEDNTIIIPSEAQWGQTVPEWANEQRERILQNIKTELGDSDFVYSYDENDAVRTRRQL